MGVPISSAVFGDPSIGQAFGILAAISSFIFQLPLQLVFFECYALDRDRSTNVTHHTEQDEMDKDPEVPEEEEEEAANGKTELVTAISHDSKSEQHVVMESAPEPKTSVASTEVQEKWWQLTGGKYVNRRDVWVDILKRVLKNPILWGIFIGFVLSLSTLGPTYLNSTSPDFVEGLAWIDETLSWLGDMVSPLSLFAMGLWMQAQGLRRLFFVVPPYKIALFMLSKLVIVPLLMVGLAKAFALSNVSSRAAVLIATLPISLASFSLGHQYSVGEAVLATNVAVGTILMLPTFLVWNLVMDSLNLFPID